MDDKMKISLQVFISDFPGAQLITSNPLKKSQMWVAQQTIWGQQAASPELVWKRNDKEEEEEHHMAHWGPLTFILWSLHS